jgi:hypothetical protein
MEESRSTSRPSVRRHPVDQVSLSPVSARVPGTPGTKTPVAAGGHQRPLERPSRPQNAAQGPATQLPLKAKAEQTGQRDYVYLRDKPAFFEDPKYLKLIRPLGKAPGEFKNKHALPLESKVDDCIAVKRGKRNPNPATQLPLKPLHEKDSLPIRRGRRQVEVFNQPSQRVERGKRTFVCSVHPAKHTQC